MEIPVVETPEREIKSESSSSESEREEEVPPVVVDITKEKPSESPSSEPEEEPEEKPKEGVPDVPKIPKERESSSSESETEESKPKKEGFRTERIWSDTKSSVSSETSEKALSYDVIQVSAGVRKTRMSKSSSSSCSGNNMTSFYCSEFCVT